MSIEPGQRQAHWDAVYERKAITEVSWYEPSPQTSLQFIRDSGILVSEPIIDVGGGASFLVNELLSAGYRDLTVLDVSASVLRKLQERLGPRAQDVTLLHRDITAFEPERRYALWHDRAVFHFLVEREDRQRYVNVLHQALQPKSHLVIAGFGPSGPDRCSGLPTMRYDDRGLAAELGADFQLAASSLVTHHTPWNSAQQFLYCRFERRAS